MTRKQYWLTLFSGETWREFMAAGGKVMGFKSHRKKSVERLRPGDYLLCYVTGISRFIGLLQVTSQSFVDDSRIWKDDVFPFRVNVVAVITLSLEAAIPVSDLKDNLLRVQAMAFPSKWGSCFQTSLARWCTHDGQTVVEALQRAAKKPTPRPYDCTKLSRSAKRLS